MSKNLELKKQAVSDIVGMFQNAKSVVIVEYKGLSVEEITALRAKFRQADVKYVVLKNTLVRRAMDEMKITGLDETLTGPSAFAFSNGDAVSAAKLIKEHMDADKRNTMKVKAGIVDGTVVGPQEVAYLASLPPREVLLAKLLGSLNAPASNLVGVLSATLRSLVYALDAVRKQKEGEA